LSLLGLKVFKNFSQTNARGLITEKGATFARMSAMVIFTCSSDNHTARNSSFVTSGKVKDQKATEVTTNQTYNQGYKSLVHPFPFPLAQGWPTLKSAILFSFSFQSLISGSVHP